MFGLCQGSSLNYRNTDILDKIDILIQSLHRETLPIVIGVVWVHQSRPPLKFE